jgi:drug/metabolite transporter (DMT)-like permease
MGALTKQAARTVDTWNVVLWRSVVVTAVSFALLRRAGISLRPGNPKLLVWRALVGMAAMLCYFWSLGRVPLGTATTLLYTSPLLTVLLSPSLLHERPARGTLPLAIVGFVGVALIVRPAVLGLDLGVLAALSSSVFAALAFIAVRALRQSDPSARIVWYFSVISILLSAPPALYHGLPTRPVEWLVLLGVGIAATGGQLSMTQAYRVERAAVVGPLSYATVVLSFLLGLLLWSEMLTALATVGMALVIVAGVAVARTADATSGTRFGG